MARTRGSRDKAYDDRRAELIRLARAHLSTRRGNRASWRDLAAACGVSVSTMVHYFGNRAALIAAILDAAHAEGQAYLAVAATPSGPFDASLADLVTLFDQGLVRGVLALQIIGLGEGFGDSTAGRAYLDHHLEPMLGAVAARLAEHQRRGEMREGDTRHAAIALVSPLLVAHLHQHALDGRSGYPLDMNAFARAHLAGFLRAHRA